MAALPYTSSCPPGGSTGSGSRESTTTQCGWTSPQHASRANRPTCQRPLVAGLPAKACPPT
eukprot:11145746-Alexandrium_andersonii.AAC.1